MSPRRTITEVDGRRNPNEPQGEPRYSRADTPREWTESDETPTGLRSAERLAAELEAKTRELAEAREALAKKGTEEAEPVDAELQFKAHARSRNLTAVVMTIAGLLGAGGGAASTAAMKQVERLNEPPPTRAQLDEMSQQMREIREKFKAQREFLDGSAEDRREFERLVVAFMCSQRRLLAQGVDCEQVLSTVQVNPDPLTTKQPPQLVIHGAKLPTPRKPPNE